MMTQGEEQSSPFLLLPVNSLVIAASEVKMENYFRVGVLTSPHGLKGEIKVFPTTDDIDRFDDLKRVFIDLASGKGAIKGSGMLETEVDGVKYFKNTAIVKFKGIETIEEISKYKGMDLLVSREDALPLEEGEYYVSDVLGCRIVSDEDIEYGTVSDVIETGANMVIVVTPNEEYSHLKEFCIPYIPECVLKVDVDERKVLVHIMKGLLD